MIINRYSTEDLDDSLAHLSNTARGVEDENFDEEKFVLVNFIFIFVHLIIISFFLLVT